MNKRSTAPSAQKKTLRLALSIAGFIISLLLPAAALAASSAGNAGWLSGLLGGDNQQTVRLVILLTLLGLLPTMLIMLTGFTRIIIVLSFVRNAIGTQQMPPNQILIGLALFITLLVMFPAMDTINQTAYTPYINQQITAEEAVENTLIPLREFMYRQVYKSDLNFFLQASGIASAPTLAEVPTRVLIPAFLTSEIKMAFQIGFMIYLPFIVIDMVVASTLMAMGMMMLPPSIISLPFKVLLFVMVDGWQMTIGSLIKSFH